MGSDAPVKESSMQEKLYFYRRGSQVREEEVILGGGLMRWAYQSRCGKPLAAFLFTQAWPSRLAGWVADRSWSRRQIAPVIRQLALDTSEFAETPESYPTFNAFFSRRLKPGARPFDPDPAQIASPADGRILVYPQLEEETVLLLKGRPFTIAALLGRPAPEYRGGSAAIIRLCPADYHRFHFPVAGRILAQHRLPGRYHSVNPLVLALGIDVFAENERQVAVIENRELGRYLYAEIGAFGVGRIVQSYRGEQAGKGDEKGYFQYGGSTVVLVFQPGRCQFAADLIAHSAAGWETFLKAGEELGRILP